MEVGVSGNMVVEAIFEVTQPGPTPLTLLKVAEFVRILTRAPKATSVNCIRKSVSKRRNSYEVPLNKVNGVASHPAWAKWASSS